MRKYCMIKGNGICLPVISETETLAVVQYCDQEITIEKQFLSPIPTPQYHVGDPVKFIRAKKLRFGIVAAIYWHWKHQSHIYQVIEKGKQLKKRYYAYDLCALNWM